MLSRALHSLTIGALLFASTACGSFAGDNSTKTTVLAGENAGAEDELARPAFEPYEVSLAIEYDEDYLDALKTRAEAALTEAEAQLVSAEADARRSDAEVEVLRQASAEIAKELRRLDKTVSELDRERAQIQGLGRTLERLTKGVTSKEVLEATSRFATIAELPLAAWLTVSVPPLAVDDFISRGAFVVRDGRITANQVEPFAGGNLLSYIEFLSDRRQDVRLGSAAHEPFLKLYDQIQTEGRKRLDRLASQKEEIAKQRRATWAPLLTLIEAMEAE